MIVLALGLLLVVAFEIDLRCFEPRWHRESRLARLLLPERYLAFAFGRHIFVRRKVLTALQMKHELVHVDQWRRYGLVGFLALYVYYQLRYGYKNNPLEHEARVRSHHG